MIRCAAVLAAAVLIAGPAQSQGTEFAPVHELTAFLKMVEGRALRIPLYGLAIQLSPDGAVCGRALGSDITGNWRWNDGYFCREMDWKGRPIPYNCQLVEASGDRMRFTVDRGAGDSAVFRLR